MTRRTRRELSAWCPRELGSPVERVLFEAGFASRVLGPRLQDGREVVTRLPSSTPRLLGAALVQRHLWAAGLWVAVFDARRSRLEDRGEGFAELVRRDAPERLRRAGA